MRWEVLTLLIVAFGKGNVLCCKPFEVSRGKRLLELKANLGKVLGQCKKEVHNILALLQRGDLSVGMEAFCKVHSKCMDSLADDGTAKEVLECWGVALENKTYMLYSSKDFTPVQLQRVKEILVKQHDFTDCFLRTEVVDLPPQVFDDLAALWNQYIKSTGR